MSRRYVTDEPNPAERFAVILEDPRVKRDSRERFALYRLCECAACDGTGKRQLDQTNRLFRCTSCRGEGRTRDLVATCATPEAVGVALVTLGREHEWDECPIGVLDTMGEPGEKWIVRPWLPSARNLSDAGRVLQTARKGKA